jgi:hypothetical protein
MELSEETDICQSCGQRLVVEHLIVTECDDILCAACTAHHDCSVCFPSEHDSDSEYTPTSGDESDSTESSESSDIEEVTSSDQES